MEDKSQNGEQIEPRAKKLTPKTEQATAFTGSD